MITFLSLVTSVKDYVEIVHKLIESDSSFKINNYDEFGPIITYILITLQEFFRNILTLKWLNSLWDLPIIIPDISSAMISEISILDGYFHNAFNFLDKPLSYGETNLMFYNLEKFSIGLINSLFLFIPTGTSHLITIRRFVMQGLEAGYLAGLGSIVGNIFWITSIIFGFRFFVIPWLSLDIFRYILGFVLLVKYMWDSYNERKMVVTTEPAKQKIFLLNFLLALTEQTSIYPFITNISIGSESSILESFPAQDLTNFLTIHCSYILGLTLGCLSLLHLTCWFWENPAFKIYMWLISSFKVSTNFYYKVLNFIFLYLTMICAISSIPYYGLDYTLTNPLGLVQDDRILYQPETLMNAPQLSFLGTKASDRNTRRNRGRHGRRERWKRRIRKYRTFDASLYDQGIYDLFTMEDLNYGFDRFWLRRKMRNHRVRFRFFPGSWMRSFKKQLAKPRLESYAGPRQEFFRILFEQVYHPSFHVYSTSSTLSKNTVASLGSARKETSLSERRLLSSKQNLNFSEEYKITASNLGLNTTKDSEAPLSFFFKNDSIANSQLKSSIYSNNIGTNQDSSIIKENLKIENSILRKFVRKMDTRIKTSEINNNLTQALLTLSSKAKGTKPREKNSNKDRGSNLYSKRWKQIFSKMSHLKTTQFPNENLSTNNKAILNNFYENSLGLGKQTKQSLKMENVGMFASTQSIAELSLQPKKQNSQINFSNQDQQILKYRSIYLNSKALSSVSSVPGLSPLGTKPTVTSLGQPSMMVTRRTIIDGRGKQQNQGLVSQEDFFETTKHNPPHNLINEISTPFTLFHPLKFYQKKQQAFEKKLHYYTPTIFRKFSIENNAPYFRVMMKRYFYYYKPTLRWERTMKVASLRKARRKTPSRPRKIQFPADGNGLAFYPQRGNSAASSTKGLPLVRSNPEGRQSNPEGKGEKSSQSKETFPFFGIATVAEPREEWDARDFKKTNSNNNNNLVRKTIPTHNYTIVGKRASRYRYQIYKDVLQHWYYTPFNRLLLKFDVDLFIKRQPNSHFLTKSEENLLHLRRFLLAEHYNTLRWYTQMEHYRSMKTKIGGTKSFSSGVYNQQFTGTFKKIRHLFAITPSQTSQTILKFDQPLYNEYFNNSKNNFQANLIIHEELLTNTKTIASSENNLSEIFKEPIKQNSEAFVPLTYQEAKEPFSSYGTEGLLSRPSEGASFQVQTNSSGRATLLGKDLLNQSTQIIGEYLKTTNPIKQEYIKKLLQEKNYVELTNFLYKGKKTRGFKPVTNYSDFLTQEKEYLLTNNDIKDLKELEKINLDQYLKSVFPTDLWIQLLKKWKRKINDQEFLKNYLQRRVEKREKRKLKKKKNIQTKLQLLETTGFFNNSFFWQQNLPLGSVRDETFAESTPLNEKNLTTGVQKALNDGLLTLNKPQTGEINKSILHKQDSDPSKLALKDLKYQLLLKKENDLSISLNQLSSILKQAKNQKMALKNTGMSTNLNSGYAPVPSLQSFPKGNRKQPQFMSLKNLWETSSGKAKQIFSFTPTKLKDFYKMYQSKSKNFLKTKILKVFTRDENRQNNFKNWQGKERALNKEKRMRKEFKSLSKNPFKYDSKNYSKYLDQKSDLPLTFFTPPHSEQRLRSEFDSNGPQKNLFSLSSLDQSKGSAMTKSNLSSVQVKILSDSIFENSTSFPPELLRTTTKGSNEGSSASGPRLFPKLSLRKKLDYSTPNSLLEKESPSIIDGFVPPGLLRLPSGNKAKGKQSSNADSSTLSIAKQNIRVQLNKFFKNTYSKYFSKKFKRKKSPQRRVRIRKNRAVIKKRTLNDSLKREFKNLRRYNQTLDMNRAQLAAFSVTGEPLLKNQVFKPSLLQRRAKQKKQRFWKQKRGKYAQKLRKYRKRRRSVLGKIRILNKQLKKIKATTDLKNWWWKNFLPNLRATTDSLWQYEKDRQIQQKLSELSVPEILERDKLSYQLISNSKEVELPSSEASPLGSFGRQSKPFTSLQIGDFDYKPLAIPEALRLKNSSSSLMPFASNSLYCRANVPQLDNTGLVNQINSLENNKSKNQPNETDIISRVSESYLLSNSFVPEERQALGSVSLPSIYDGKERQNDPLLCQRSSPSFQQSTPSGKAKSRKNEAQQRLFSSEASPLLCKGKQPILTSPIPFYAGWDDSLRKFVVTNRLLSRRESGYEMRFQDPLKTALGDQDFGEKSVADVLVRNPPIVDIEGSNPTEVISSLDKLSSFSPDILGFTRAPLKGMNTATTLYWQIPFTTYDPDQFFALGMDGFAPLGWRRFQFRHSILKSWLYEKGTLKKDKVIQTYKDAEGNFHISKENSGGHSLSNHYIVKNKINIRNNISGTFNSNKINDKSLLQSKSSTTNNINSSTSNLVYKLKEKNSIIAKYDSQFSMFDKNNRNIYRRLKKRYRRVKKHPRSPVWFPSGPLLNQVLPVHYIYIFYKRSRLPRDRYIKRRLIKSKAQINSAPLASFPLGRQRTGYFSGQQDRGRGLLLGNLGTPDKSNSIFTQIPDFTLRKRVKTKRKYHIKQDLTKQLTLIPRRVKFIGDDSISMRWRPLSRQKLNKPIADLIKEKRVLRSKQRKKELQELNSKQPANLRIKQLRRRVQRQIIRSVWRYKPRAGGFVWPGDYLKLELVKAPKLDIKSNLGTLELSSEETNKLRLSQMKMKRKKKRNIQEWQIQPKKYLLQKHNYNVIKKKLEKAQRLNKIQERTKELTLIL